jgi:hypothetical protein
MHWKMGFFSSTLDLGFFIWALMSGVFAAPFSSYMLDSLEYSTLLDGYSAASITHGRLQHHTTVDTSLTQLWRFLNQLSYAPTDCTFVYDGDERASIKRGVRVITAEPLLYQRSKEMVRIFGFRVHMVCSIHKSFHSVTNCQLLLGEG